MLLSDWIDKTYHVLSKLACEVLRLCAIYLALVAKILLAIFMTLFMADRDATAQWLG